jgi:hypothetical protein
MLGALEVKAISRLAAKMGAEWKPLHSSILGCLLAHRNRHSGNCWPKRRLIAAHSNVSERTVDRAIEQLVRWGALARQQPRAAGQQFLEAQYSFLFEIPTAVENRCEFEVKSCANHPAPCDKITVGRAPNSAAPCDKIEGVIRKEGKDLEGKDRKGQTPPLQNGAGYSKADFDARDLRKMAEATKFWCDGNPDGRSRASGATQRRIFELICERAGITIERGLELEARAKQWPEKVPDWAREGTG